MFCAEFITDRVSREGRPKAVDIAPIRLSVRYVRPFVSTLSLEPTDV